MFPFEKLIENKSSLSNVNFCKESLVSIIVTPPNKVSKTGVTKIFPFSKNKVSLDCCASKKNELKINNKQ